MICLIVPLMFGPFLTTESVTMIFSDEGIVSGGGGLLPGRVLHVPPQTLSDALAKPLKPAWPAVTRPLIWLFFHHCEPQKLTVLPMPCGSTSPTTNAGPAGDVSSPFTHRPARLNRPTPVEIFASTAPVAMSNL